MHRLSYTHGRAVPRTFVTGDVKGSGPLVEETGLDTNPIASDSLGLVWM